MFPRRIMSFRSQALLSLLIALVATSAVNAGAEAPAPDGVAPELPESYRHLEIDDCRTSIYLGSVAMDLSPLAHAQGAFKAAYRARVFPFLFYSEQGTLEVAFSPEQLEQLRRGERVQFSGTARSTGRHERAISGHATPASAGAGAIKVRVHVSDRIQLIFNTHYRFPALAGP